MQALRPLLWERGHGRLMRGADQERQGTAALADLFEEYYERIARYIAVRIGNQNDAEELAGDVFVRATEHIGSFQWRGVPVQAWLYRIAHNLVVDHLRRNSRRKTAPLDEAQHVADSHNPEREVMHSLDREELLEALGELTEAQRETIALRFFGGMSSAEAAVIMKRSNGAVRELQSSALKRLRGIIDIKHSTLKLEGR